MSDEMKRRRAEWAAGRLEQLRVESLNVERQIEIRDAVARTARRRARTGRVGKFQRISKEDSKMWFIEQLGGSVLN